MANVSRARATGIAFATAALLAVSGLSGCALTTPAISEVEEQTVSPTVSDDHLVSAGTLTVALDTNNAPQAMENNGKMTGYAVDVARALARKMGLKVTFVNGTPAGSLSEKKADIYIGADDTSQSQALTLVGSYLDDATAIYAPKSDASAKPTAESLSSKTVAVQGSSASQDALSRSGISAGQKTYSSINDCFEALDSGEVDYVACDANAGSYIARAYSGISFAGTLTEASSRYVACLSSATELTKAVGNALDGITADGTLDAIHTLWFGNTPIDLSKSELSKSELSGISDSSTSSEADATADDASDDSSETDSAETSGSGSTSDASSNTGGDTASSSKSSSKSTQKLDISDDDINKLKTD